MTLIVGIVDGDGVHLGADSAVTNQEFDSTVRRESKVWRLHEDLDIVVGYCGSVRAGQIVRYDVASKLPTLDAVKAGDEADEYLAFHFVPTLRECLSKGGALETKNGTETGVSMLVGICGRLFELDDDFSFGEALCGYDAVGSGANVAKGALFALNQFTQSRIITREKLTTALSAGHEWNASVRPPFTFVSLFNEQESRE